MKDFCNLHTHTDASLMDSLIKSSELFKRVKELGQSSIAITEHGSIFSAWDCLKYSKEAGVKLIVGCEFYFLDNVQDTSGRLRHLILLAKNAEGYRNLLALSKHGYEHSIVMFKKVIPRIDWKALETYKEGLICTTACGGGILSQLINTRKVDQAKQVAKRLQDIFGENLALEIQPHGMRRVANAYKDYEDQRFTNIQLIKIGDELGIKVIVATDSHYMNPEDYEAHDVLLAIGSGQPITSGNRLKYTSNFHLQSRDEIVKSLTSLLGSYKTRAEEFCDNTLFFSEMCEQPEWIDPKYYRPKGVNWELPDFPVKDQPDYQEFLTWKESQNFASSVKEDEAYLRYWCDKNFDRRLKHVPIDQRQQYIDQVEKEIDVFVYKNLCSYMLIVADYIDFAKKQRIPVGPGRGSVGGSLVAYLMDIHDAEPIKYGLIFERFYSKTKMAASDIDTDFSKAGKPIVEQYVIDKYGRDNCAKITNLMALTPKPYSKAIAKTFMYGGDHKAAIAIGNAIADVIPKDIHSVTEALEKAPVFAEYAASEKYNHLGRFAKQIGNRTIARSTHAAAMIICGKPIHHIVPVRKDKDGEWAVEHEKERAEAHGLIKMDFLGLSTLDIIDNTFKLIEEQGKTPPSLPWNYDENDEKTYDLISSGNNYGVFQLGTSAGTIDLCKRLQPRSIPDCAVINALTRPGVPKEFREKFIEAKFSGKQVELLHPCLKRSLEPTYNIPVFDESLLTLGADVAGWDLNESDRLRKFVKDKGKHPEKDEQLKKDFIASASKNLNDPETAKLLWEELFANFNAYLFNLAHAIEYSFISYQTAYLKAHFPLEYLVADLSFNCESSSFDAEDNIAIAKNEIRKLGVHIIPPNVNKSEISYKIVNKNTLMTGLNSLKNIGKHAIPEIIAKRPYTSFEDFMMRVDGRKVTSPSVQALAASGCLDEFGMTRKQMFLYAQDYRKKLQVWTKRKNKEEGFKYPWPEDKQDWTVAEKFALERFYIGEGLAGNKFQAYPGFFNSSAPRFSEYAKTFPDPGDSNEHHPVPVFQAEIISFFEFKVKKEDSKSFGKPMAKLMLEDPYGNPMSMTVFPKQWPEFKERIKTLTGGKAELGPGVVMFGRGSLNWYEGTLSLIYEDILKCAPPPPLPSDLKSKKVTMKVSRSRKKGNELDKEELLEQVEEELIENGMEDMDEDFDAEAFATFDFEDEEDLITNPN